MNTETTEQNTAPATLGERLRQAREDLGMSRQIVAERLFLKVSTVRDIEEDSTPGDLAPTFLRGYIRSYAKLVHLPEDELLPLLDKQVVPKVSNVARMQSFSLGKSRKKRDGWLMLFTWLIVLVVLGLTGAWWWQNHQAQRQEINAMVGHAESLSEQSVPLAVASSAADGAAVGASADPVVPQAPAPEPAAADAGSAGAVVPAAPAGDEAAQAAASQPEAPAAEEAPAQPGAVEQTAEALPTAVPGNMIVMTFTADCWLEVIDASGKKLFSGLQRSGGALNLSGQAPYRLKIGAPAAVHIEYQGKPVDLDRFVRSNQVARLTLAAE